MKQKTLKKELVQITWPIFVESILFMLIGIIDVAMLSHYNNNASGAIGIVNTLINMFNIFFSIITAGTSIICVQYIGAGKDKLENQKLIGASLIFNTLIGILFSILIFFFHDPLLRFMNTSKTFWDFSQVYLIYIGSTIFLQAIMSTFTASLRAYSYTQLCMYVTVIVNTINILGNYCLIYGKLGLPSLGVKGAAISTVISKIIGVVILGIMCRKKVMNNFSLSNLKPFPFYHLKNVLKLGTPAGGESIAYNGAKLVITIILTYIGTAAVNANTYVNSISTVIFIFAVATGQGTSIIVGRLVGENSKDDAHKLCLFAYYISLVITISMSIFVIVFHVPILRIFTNDTELIHLCRNIFLVDLILELGRCTNVVIINSLRAAGDVNFPVIMGILSMWGIGVLLSYVLGILFHLGIIGVWIALASDEVLRGIIMYIRWQRGTWRNKQIV